MDDTTALQIVVRLERTATPTRSAALTAAATAVGSLLTDPRATTTWAPALASWRTALYRKHTRRARGAAWDRTAHLEHAQVTVAGVQVRAFPPLPGDLPGELARLQMSGTELPDPYPVRAAAGIRIAVAPGLTFGKAAAACGHAVQMLLDQPFAHQWAGAGFPLTITHPTPAQWATCHLDPVVIVDAGLTETAPGTITATARW